MVFTYIQSLDTLAFMHTGKLTKIVATIGPSSSDPQILRELILKGVNVYRFNMKHNVPEWHAQQIKVVQKIADDLGVNIGIMIDLQGSEIRINTKDEEIIKLKKGECIKLICKDEDFENGDNIVKISNPNFIEKMSEGDHFSIEDGYYEFIVGKKISKHEIEAISQDDAVIKDKKSLNLVGKFVDLPSLIEADLDRLNVATNNKVDFVALSYVASKKDIEILINELLKRKLTHVQIVAKIENQGGLDNIDSIIDGADAIMIARGDLGIETPMEKVPFLQKEIIKKCRDKNKPVIVATQMLESMLEKPIPTRAEAADVANAVYDKTDAVMLSGETATGKYPLKAVEYMRRIVKYNETRAKKSELRPKSFTQTHAIVRAALEVLEPDSGTRVDKVVIFTETGYTARTFSSYRSKIPAIAVSPNLSTVETLTMSYGVLPYLLKKVNLDDFVDRYEIVDELKSADLVKSGERLLLIHGNQKSVPGQTNALTLLEV